MQRLRNTFNNLWAALIFFTRLPFWRLHEPPQQSFSRVVEWWPLCGWLTGGVMAAVLYGASLVMPYSIAVILAILSRLLITGALHEDGLADFFDGFGGGGTDRERILAIMKDSRIGTYGVISLIVYFLLLFAALSYMSPMQAALTILMADPFAKMISAQMILMLPYARTADTAKNRTVYQRPGIVAGILLAVQGLLPLAAYMLVSIFYFGVMPSLSLIIFVPSLTMYALYYYLHRRLGGYTGDCCGAAFLMVELAVYLCMVI